MPRVRVGHASGSTATMRVCLPSRSFCADERERQPSEVRPAADAADDHVRVLARDFHLLERLLADDRLVQQHVVEHRPERVVRVVVRRGVLDGF